MKLVNGLAILSFFSILFGSCFEPPDAPPIPEIVYEDIRFVETPGTSTPDSLIVYIRFKDGDGDLGLSPSETSAPYHPANFYLEDGNGNMHPISTAKLYSNLPDFVSTGGQSGKLVTVRTRKKPGYAALPAFKRPRECVNYLFDTLYVSEEDKHILDNSYNIVDTLRSNPASGQPNVYVLLDTFYFQRNPDHYNIEVDFLEKRPGHPDDLDNDGFVEFDWAAEPLCQSFDGRFPVLSDRRTPLDGTLKYSMNSTGFLALFSLSTLKLRIQIKDHDLNRSNVVETKQFTLKSITTKSGG